MNDTRTAKLFKNGASQAVRLPADFRFAGDEVYATRDAVTGDVVLSTRPGGQAWTDFFELVHSVSDSGNFMQDRPMNQPPKKGGVFDDGPASANRRAKGRR